MNNNLNSHFDAIYRHHKLYSFDVEYIENPIQPTINNLSRILFFSEGEGKIKIYDREYTIVPNTLLLLFPWELIEITEVKKPLVLMKILYNSVFSNLFLNMLDKNKKNIIILIKKYPFTYLDKIESKKIKNIFYEIKNEIGTETLSDLEILNDSQRQKEGGFDYNTLYITNKLTEIVLLAVKKLISNDDKKLFKMENNTEDNIIKYIYAHLNERLTLNKLSVIFFMSESSIAKYIENVTGFTFNELLRQMRISKVLNLLVYTDMNVEEVAHLTGFTDGAHISKLCNKYLNMKPSEYREYYKNNYQIYSEKDMELVYSILNYIYENYTTDLTISKITSKYNITDTKLNSILISYSGKRFIDFLNDLRINKACELLLTTDKSIIDISFELGYNTVKSFNNNFFKLKNITPTEMRKNVKPDLI